MRDMTEANRAEFESFMAERFTDSIDRRRCINGDGNDYMSWDMVVAREVWQHMQQKLDAVLAEVVAIREQAENVYASGYNQGHLNTVDGCAYAATVKDDFYHNALQVMLEVETPATDTLLNAVRAEAIEQAAEKAPWLYGDQMGRSVEAIPKEQLLKWAAQLRNIEDE